MASKLLLILAAVATTPVAPAIAAISIAVPKSLPLFLIFSAVSATAVNVSSVIVLEPEVTPAVTFLINSMRFSFIATAGSVTVPIAKL